MNTSKKLYQRLFWLTEHDSEAGSAWHGRHRHQCQGVAFNGLALFLERGAPLHVYGPRKGLQAGKCWIRAVRLN